MNSAVQLFLESHQAVDQWLFLDDIAAKTGFIVTEKYEGAFHSKGLFMLQDFF